MKGFLFSANEKFLSGRREDWMVVFVERRCKKIHSHVKTTCFTYLFIHTDVTRN